MQGYIERSSHKVTGIEIQGLPHSSQIWVWGVLHLRKLPASGLGTEEMGAVNYWARSLLSQDEEFWRLATQQPEWICLTELNTWKWLQWWKKRQKQKQHCPKPWVNKIHCDTFTQWNTLKTKNTGAQSPPAMQRPQFDSCREDPLEKG